MANFNILSEFEKSSEHLVSREGYFHEVWSNEKATHTPDIQEFNNSFLSEGDNEKLSKETLTFSNEEDGVSAIIPQNDNNITHIPEDETSAAKEMDEGLNPTPESDGVDYFDSEDEYFETYRNKFEKFLSTYGVGMPVNTANETGRYSQGLSQYFNMPVFMNSLQKFADDNSFKVHDVMADGNCLFRAIADQLEINGIFGNSPKLLREITMKYLRENPCQEDGSHTEAFLFNESWEQYLTRMDKPTEWCDHILLKAAVDTLRLKTVVFNVYESDIRRTEISPVKCNKPENNLTIYLGHMGEFHYLSLRPKDWDKEWQKKALLCRYVVCSRNWDSDASQHFLRNQVNRLGLVEFVENNKSFLGIKSDYKPASDEGVLNSGYSLCPSYALQDLEPGDMRDHRLNFIANPFHVDGITGIPFKCLSFLIRHLLPRYTFFFTYVTRGDPEFEIEGTLFRYLGSSATKTNVIIKETVPILCCNRDNDTLDEIGATVAAVTGNTARYSITQDTSATYPGYVRLKVNSSNSDFLPKDLYRDEGYTFLKRMEVSEKTTLPRNTKRCFIGLDCKKFPSIAQEWINRERKFQWPSRAVVDFIQMSGCTIISKHHPSSINPDIEWKYDFSRSEVILFERALTSMQYYGFFVIKTLLEDCTAHLQRRLKQKHTRAVFFNSCEHISIEAWETNLGGCILQLISYIAECLKKKNLPNYFISKRNMLHGFSEEELNRICIQIEALRLFPLQRMVHMAENRHFSYASNLTKAILQDCARFTSTADICSAYQETLLPNTIKTVKFLTRRGQYEPAFCLLVDTINAYINDELLSFSMSSSCTAAELFVSALSELRQETSRVVLAMKFETNYGEHILDSLMKKEEIFLKDLLPWGTSDNVAWLRVPEDKMENYELLAEFLLEFGKAEMKNLNTYLAELAFSEAIRCLEKNIEDTPMLDVSNIEDDMLKRDIQSQKSNILRNIKEKLKDCYIQMYYISQIHRLYNPLEKYLHAIEELCTELPEMSGIVSVMFGFLRNHSKQKEYAELYDIFLGTGTRHKVAAKNIF